MEEIKIDTNLTNSNNKHGKTIGIIMISIILVLALIVFSVVTTASTPVSYLTYDKFNQISNGMTYNQVVSILGGHEGELSTSASSGGYSLAYYSWTTSIDGYKSIVVGFENGCVCAKSQIGLK